MTTVTVVYPDPIQITITMGATAAALGAEIERATAAEALRVLITGSGVWAPNVSMDGSGLTVTVDCQWSFDSEGNAYYDPDQVIPTEGGIAAYLGPGLTLYPLTNWS